MLVVKIDLHSAVDGSVQEIGRMYVANDGMSEDERVGDYDVAVCRRRTQTCPWYQGAPRAVRQGRVTKYPRLSKSVWVLVLRALRACYPEEK